jgi:CBS domain-containing protein
MQVSDCMTTDVCTVKPDDTIQDAAKAMADIDAGSLPIEDGDRLVGFITDRDIAIRGIGHGCGPDTRVGDLMSRELKYCFEDDDIDDVLDNMAAIQVRRLPVLNRDKRLVGIVSITDLAFDEHKHAGEALGQIARPSERHSQH